MKTFWALNPFFALDSKNNLIPSASANSFALSAVTCLFSSKSHLFPIKNI